MRGVHLKLNPGLPWRRQLSRGRRFCTSKLGLNFRKKLLNRYIWSTALYGADIWTLRNVDQKYLEILGTAVMEKDEGDRLDRSCEK